MSDYKPQNPSLFDLDLQEWVDNYEKVIEEQERIIYGKKGPERSARILFNSARERAAFEGDDEYIINGRVFDLSVKKDKG